MSKSKICSAYLVMAAAVLTAIAMCAPVSAASKTGGPTPISDYDPTVDLTMTLTIDEIWALDYLYVYVGNFWWTVEIGSLNTDGVLIWDTETSAVYRSYDGHEDAHFFPDWSFTSNVFDGSGMYYFVITLYNEMNIGGPSEICDISGETGGGPAYPVDASNAEFNWNQKYGTLTQGYSSQTGLYHLSGISDGSFGYEDDENDCELYFSVTWNDNDADGLTYYLETSVYGTNPRQSDVLTDLDGDGIPLIYEDKYKLVGMSYSSTDDVTNDRDGDGLTGMEEYTFRAWGTAPDYPDILLEVDYETGYLPNPWVLDYIEKYFANYQVPDQSAFMSPPFGINVIVNVDDEIASTIVDPDEIGVEGEELIDVAATYFTPGAAGAWRYCLVGQHAYPDAWLDEYPYNEIPDVSEERFYFTLGLTLNAAPRHIFIALGTITERVDDYNDDWLDPNIVLNHVVACVFLHELGHSLDIISWKDSDGDGRVAENYCSDLSCVMSLFDGHDFYYNRDLPYGPLFCAVHWAQLELDVWATAPITPVPDGDDSDPNV